MDQNEIERHLTRAVPKELAKEIVADYIQIRLDFSGKVLGRSSPGKFVEGFVQVLQYLATGKFDKKPNVDGYLNKGVESSGLDEGLRICAARAARTMYTLRNKRSIAHKNGVDPNAYDLGFLNSSASWIMSELVRHISQISMAAAGHIISQIQAPVSEIAEIISDTTIVHADINISDEILLVFHSHYPDVLTQTYVFDCLSRRSKGSVRNRLRELHSKKLLHGNAKDGYTMTRAGFRKAEDKIIEVSQQP